jgi:6-pyruvoyltetrahydropterin/6-carboxytetrahydropterin synthase
VRVSRDFVFEAAHRLENYGGECEALHGHTWKFRVTVEAPVNEEGLAFDFVELKRIVGEKILSRLDHAYLNDILPVPTAEHVAVWIWERLSHLPIAEIRVWETSDCMVAYVGEEE